MSRTIGLSREEAESLGPTLKRMSLIAHRPFTIDGLLNAWQAFVSEVEIGYQYSVDEYTNDLSTRNLIQRLIDEAPSSARDKIMAAVETVDHRFDEATVEIETPLRDWPFHWWRRVPRLLLGSLKLDLAREGYA